MALGTPNSLLCVAVLQTRSRKRGIGIFVGGYLIPGYLLCLAFDLGSSIRLWLVIL